jgi:DNA-binding beta-propeller fold protein YncE
MKESKNGLKKMNSGKELRQSVVAVTLIVLGMIMGPMIAFAQEQTDFLYIGDGDNNTIKKVDINNGNVETFVESGSGGLYAPTGLLFVDGKLLVASQNAGLNIPGEILQYNGTTGKFEKALISSTDKNSPTAPRGIIIDGSKLYVADLVTGVAARGKSLGRIRSYDLDTGNFLGNLGIEGIKNIDSHPRGMVFGPDDNLYVSFRDLRNDGGLGGHVLRFNHDGSFDKVFIAEDGGVGKLNRPEGLVFGPDENLYITSFRANPNDTDSIRKYSKDGDFISKIDLDTATLGPDRAYAQALLFGPEGYLFVPISGPIKGIYTGELRRYNVDDGSYESLVAAGGNLIAPQYLTFGKTDPKDLSYQE